MQKTNPIMEKLENIIHLNDLIQIANKTDTRDILHQSINYSKKMYHIIETKKKDNPYYDQVSLTIDIYKSLITNNNLL
ncbi:MAG: hypothetical protein U9R34_00390 [Nanoarchaeota archaeon]|nr:hypothetical protein [Nanoarchaeota archaeon]